MKEEQDKKLEDFIKKSVVEAGMEEPSEGFTNSVLEKIAVMEERKRSVKYVPLISKRTWIVIAVVILGLCVMMLTQDWGTIHPDRTVPFLKWMPHLELSGVLDQSLMNSLENIQLHRNVVYAVLIFSFFIYIQIFMIKRRAD